MSKFFAIKVDDFFYLSPSKPKFILPGLNIHFETHSLNTGLQACKKASVLTYINLSEPVMGEIGYDPSIDGRIVTQAEKQAADRAVEEAAAAAVKKATAKKVVKKAVVKKAPAKKKAVKSITKKVAAKKAPAKKTVVKKAVAKKAVKVSPKKTVVKKATKKKTR